MSNFRAWQVYRVLGPIDQPGWLSVGVDGTERLTTVSGECTPKTAVFLSPVTRSIASEHKVRAAPRIAVRERSAGNPPAAFDERGV